MPPWGLSCSPCPTTSPFPTSWVPWGCGRSRMGLHGTGTPWVPSWSPPLCPGHQMNVFLLFWQEEENGNRAGEHRRDPAHGGMAVSQFTVPTGWHCSPKHWLVVKLRGVLVSPKPLGCSLDLVPKEGSVPKPEGLCHGPFKWAAWPSTGCLGTGTRPCSAARGWC